jgi:hypothetical protein
MAILAGTATAGQMLQSGASTTPAWSTTTYPATNAINTIMYASSANVLDSISPVNNAVMVSSAGGVPSWSATLPAFTTSSITFNPTTGGIVGTTTNDNAAAGKVGEFISNVVSAGSAVSTPGGTPTYIASVSLTAGDWDVWGNFTMNAVSASPTACIGWLSSAGSAAVPDNSLLAGFQAAVLAGTGVSVPYQRFSLSTTTTVSIGVYYATGNGATACGGIYARRAR